MFIEKANKLLSRLENDKRIEVHSFFIYPPMDTKTLKDIEKEYFLPDVLAAFYIEMNGFQLSYTFRNNKDFDKGAFGYYDNVFPKMWPNENYWHLDGCINLLPLDFCTRNNWEDYIWFMPVSGPNPKLEFERKLIPFDLFSKDSIAALYARDNECKVYLSTDHNASYYDYQPTDPGNYLDGLFETNGLIASRTELFTPA